MFRIFWHVHSRPFVMTQRGLGMERGKQGKRVRKLAAGMPEPMSDHEFADGGLQTSLVRNTPRCQINYNLLDDVTIEEK